MSSDVEQVSSTISSSSKIDSIVLPYKSGLAEEMMEVIAFAPRSFERGKPNGALNNWSCDAVLQVVEVDTEMPVMVLLNVGGLRNPINQGDVTIEDMFKLMPFDNEVVIVTMPISSLNDINAYLIDRGGEPIGNAKLENGMLEFNSPMQAARKFQIVTSDYLMNGGDYMKFFQQRISEKYTGQLLRDVFIDAAKLQDTLIWNNEERIILRSE